MVQVAGATESHLLAQLYSNRAATNLLLEDLDAAKKDAKRASELAPQWAKPHFRLTDVYHKMLKHSKLEVALGLAQAAGDSAVEREIRKKMPEYLQLRTQEMRRESENLAFDPTFLNEGATKQVILGLDMYGRPGVVFAT